MRACWIWVSCFPCWGVRLCAGKRLRPPTPSPEHDAYQIPRAAQKRKLGPTHLAQVITFSIAVSVSSEAARSEQGCAPAHSLSRMNTQLCSGGNPKVFPVPLQLFCIHKVSPPLGDQPRWTEHHTVTQQGWPWRTSGCYKRNVEGARDFPLEGGGSREKLLYDKEWKLAVGHKRMDYIQWLETKDYRISVASEGQ